MKYGAMNKIYGHFFYHVCKKGLKKQVSQNTKLHKKLMKEYKNINLRAKDIGKSNRLLSAYLMAAYFIAMNRVTGLSEDENYSIFEQGLLESVLFRKVLGNADSYLDEEKMSGRKQWDRDTHERKYANDWVVTVLEGNSEFELGYNYEECGVCKLCQDEGCFELAKYLCKTDFLMADLMGMKLVRTGTIAEGNKLCDFRYSHK